jgi:hypothetical protein
LPVAFLGRKAGFLAAVLLSLIALPVQAYDGSAHQFMTFLAAKQFNRCVEGTDIPALTPLQVRYIAKANTGLADRSVFARMFNWRYYDRDDQSEQSMMWVVDTRFHDHFDELSGRLQVVEDPVAAYQDLGRAISYIQLVSSPPRVVPVYVARFWRFSFSDRFDGYPLDEEALVTAIEGDCRFLETPPESYADVLVSVAERTLEAVLEPISGLPTDWTAFWRPNRKADGFGDYGPAGNSFGRRTEFRCAGGERCVLLKDDPLYAEFALARHADAVRGTQSAMLRMQLSMRDTVASAP